MRRMRINKRKSARKFTKNLSHTKQVNMGGVMRGGYRL
ncbi:MAG: hypothetical protein [Microvirus sp.]|nr:MAG: hypothetical protein [Microvirus sp.]